MVGRKMRKYFIPAVFLWRFIWHCLLFGLSLQRYSTEFASKLHTPLQGALLIAVYTQGVALG